MNEDELDCLLIGICCSKFNHECIDIMFKDILLKRKLISDLIPN